MSNVAAWRYLDEAVYMAVYWAFYAEMHKAFAMRQAEGVFDTVDDAGSRLVSRVVYRAFNEDPPHLGLNFYLAKVTR